MCLPVLVPNQGKIEMKKAFTITELLVAMGLLAAVLLVSGTVFSYSLDAQRHAMATAEVMRTVRAVVGQINSDFDGWYEDSPVVVGFHKTADSLGEVRADDIAFFAVGAFETTNSYSGSVVNGNVARIYYGQAKTPDCNSTDPNIGKIKILARRQTIVSADSSLTVEPVEYAEYDSEPLLEQQKTFNNNKTVTTRNWLTRPTVDPNNDNEYPMYFAAGIDNFTIQIEDGNDINGTIRWWPENSIITDQIMYFRASRGQFDTNAATRPNDELNIDAIKFSFTVYDSQGIFKQGRRFEHIVYIRKR